jgi:hypothetical protein
MSAVRSLKTENALNDDIRTDRYNLFKIEFFVIIKKIERRLVWILYVLEL